MSCGEGDGGLWVGEGWVVGRREVRMRIDFISVSSFIVLCGSCNVILPCSNYRWTNGRLEGRGQWAWSRRRVQWQTAARLQFAKKLTEWV